jgi:hypothetical protein
LDAVNDLSAEEQQILVNALNHRLEERHKGVHTRSSEIAAAKAQESSGPKSTTIDVNDILRKSH